MQRNTMRMFHKFTQEMTGKANRKVFFRYFLVFEKNLLYCSFLSCFNYTHIKYDHRVPRLNLIFLNLQNLLCDIRAFFFHKS